MPGTEPTRELRYLARDDVVDVAGFDDYVDAVREGYRQHGAGAPTAPRTKLFHTRHEGMVMYYGALLPETGVVGTFSCLGEFPDREGWFLTFLADAETGDPLAVVDSGGINPYKTGATGGVAVDALARPDASVVGVIGTGTQAMGQLLATARVRDVTEVRAYSPTATHRREFAAAAEEHLGVSASATATAEEAARDADIVITATRATEPVVDDDAIAPGTHVTAMGQSHPERRELDTATVERAVYVPDDEARARLASGELLGAVADGAVGEDHAAAELGEVVAGRAPGRTSREDVTVFDSGGTGIETIAATHMVYERAVAAGRGTELAMSSNRDPF